MTDQNVETVIQTNLADFSNITPEKHREVEYAILNAAVKASVIEIPNWQKDKQYSVYTGDLGIGEIISLIPYLKCTTANNGFQVGDIISIGTPERGDNGGIGQQGIGVQFNNNDVTSIKVLVADIVFTMEAFTNNGVPADTIEPDPNFFSIRLVVQYYNSSYSINPLD